MYEAALTGQSLTGDQVGRDTTNERVARVRVSRSFACHVLSRAYGGLQVPLTLTRLAERSVPIAGFELGVDVQANSLHRI